jgi:monomeric sarcosine oxidase
MAANPASKRQPRQLVTPPPSGTLFDIIVIGGGTIGLSAAYYASARGLNTLLIEQFDTLAGPEGSSGGASRMFRIMYAPAYMAQLAEVALAMWKEIETVSGATILEMQPLIFYGVPGHELEGNIDQMKQVLTNLGVPYSWYGSGDALMQQYPFFQNVPSNYVGLVQANSAVIRAETSVAVFEQLATANGATLITDQQASVTQIGPYGVTCQPANTTYYAPSLVLCPGAWTNSVLAPFELLLDLKIWQMTVAYYQADVGAYSYPMWYEFGDTSQTQYYGFPPDEVPGYIKVSTEFTNNIYTDPSKCTYQPEPTLLQGIGQFVQQRFAGVSSTYTDAQTCLYTMSHDGEMILDNLNGFPNASIFTGASGRGFKFTPLCGRILVDLATTGKTYYDIGPFSMLRPGVIKPGPKPRAAADRATGVRK